VGTGFNTPKKLKSTKIPVMYAPLVKKSTFNNVVYVNDNDKQATPIKINPFALAA